MKKIIIPILLVLCTIKSFSQWATSGNNIFNSNSGNVGIGTNTPTAKLSVFNNAIDVGINLQSTGNYSYIKAFAGTTSPINSFNRLEILGNSSPSDGPSMTLVGNDGQYPNRNGSISLCSYGTSGASIFFQNYNTTTGIWENHASMNKDGKFVIGSELTWVSNTPGDYKLYVERGILTEKVKVAIKTTTDWADYVFHKNYKLKTLPELDSFIQKNNHLPGIPSTPEAIANGVDLGKMTSKLLEKIEELTLYIIQINKENQALAEQVKQLATPAQISKKEDPSTIDKEILQSLVKEIETLKREIETLKN
jgi:hypothetical protein